MLMDPSDEEEAQGLRRPSRDWGGNVDDDDSDTAVTLRRPVAVVGSPSPSPSPSPPPVSRKEPVAITPKRRFISRSRPPRQSPSRSYHSTYLLSDLKGEAEEAPFSEHELSPLPSSEGSGDSIPSHSSCDDDSNQEHEDEDEYDSSFVVGDSTIEYESEDEGGGGGQVDILDLVDGFGEVNIGNEGGRGKGRGKTVGEREIERDLEWFREVRRKREEERKPRKEVYGAGLGERGRRYGEGDDGEDGEDGEDDEDDEDEEGGGGGGDSSSSEGNVRSDSYTDRGAILSYIPPTTKLLVRERTPISSSSSPIAPPLPKTTKKKPPLHPPAPTPLPFSTPARNPKVLLPPTKPITLTPTPPPSKPDPSSYRTPTALKSFKSRKPALADQFLLELDSRVTNGRVNKKLSHLGGLKVIWSKTLLTTAGYFRYRYVRSTHGRVDEDGEHLPGEHRIITFAQIELADKVVDDEHRLYSTLAHEFAHVADTVVGENWEQRCHGKGFKQWLLKCKMAFPERDIELGTCHSYVISYKYQWACIGRWASTGGTWGVEDGCGHVVKRHSKSVDVEIHRCPRCTGRLVQTLPKPVRRGGGGGEGGVVIGDGEGVQGNGAAPGLTEYQLFMKERMKVVKRGNPGMPQKEVMRLVGLEWREKKEGGGVGVHKSHGEGEKGKARVEVIEISDDGDDD